MNKLVYQRSNKSYKKLSNFIKSSGAMLPSLKDLEQAKEKINNIRNRKGEFLRKVHYGCYLLCSESGLRVSEAVKFDLNAKTRKGLYRITKTKGKKERLVYVSPAVIKKLKKHNWKPNQTNRWNFYHFLRKIKRELNLSTNIELTPHTFRRAFATYHAENGLPLPLLSELLGHSSVRTTALYWRNIHGEDDPSDIFAGKKWLENREKEPSEPPRIENFPKQPAKNPDSEILSNESVIALEKSNNQELSLDKLSDNSLLTAENEKKPTITYQPKKLISEIPPKTPEKFPLNTSKQLPLITNGEQKISKEWILLAKIKQLEEQLTKIQAENNHLKLENKHLKALIKQDQEIEAKILQPFKVKN